jgi:hypothetical protein
LAKTAAAAPIANFANNKGYFSLTWRCKQWQNDYKTTFVANFAIGIDIST